MGKKEQLTPAIAAAKHWQQATGAQQRLAWQRRARRQQRMWQVTVYTAKACKRALDILGSLLGLCISAPLVLVLGACVYGLEGGPVLFKQIRVGKGGRRFTLYKLRTMRAAAESTPAHKRKPKHAQASRIFPLGAFMRKFSLDELPQFWNVLRGEMSLVGPRPPMPAEVAHYKAAELRRLCAKPGLTCLWQVGGRSHLNFSQQVRLDVAYIHSQSLRGDIKILLRTIPAVLLGRGAY